MPEGDTIRTAANRVGAALVGRSIEAIETPHPRFGQDRWPERLAGRSVRAVDAHGKHLMIRFEGGLTIHSHLRMTGSWGVYPRGQRWHRGRHRAWLVIRTADDEVVQFDGPVLELMTDGRTRFDPRITQLGPDVLADEFDEAAFIRRLRSDDATRAIGDALLDQRIVAGIGNMWKAEGCWRAEIDPWRRLRDVADEEALAIINGVRPAMQESVGNGFPKSEMLMVYKRAGTACPRCGTTIKARGQGDDNRTTYWCPGCQR
ncbi:MAG TPA: DNA-formamidopyrimidine glycosylase family protein [Thermoleophilaceae bacterium]|jgi:endonuclease-8|nr:DNA-formamidopyrimidine glycosylase family protein [Thermoleophilaceae bacterium]